MKFCYPSCINTLEQLLIDLNLFGPTYLKSSLSYLTRLLLNIPESKKVECKHGIYAIVKQSVFVTSIDKKKARTKQ